MKYSNDTLAMVISFYNLQASTFIRCSNEWNQNVVSNALDVLNGDVKALKEHIKVWVRENPDTAKTTNALGKCMSAVRPVTVPVDVTTNSDTTVTMTSEGMTVSTTDKVSNSLSILEQALMEVIRKQSIPEIEKDIKGECTKMLQDFIKQEYGTIERKIITVVDGEVKPVTGVVHDKFSTVLKFVANDEPVFLTGPAGSGKNYLCQQVADALGLKFYFSNAVTQEYKLTGFTDAMGNYQETQFYKAFTEGGLFMLDEMDASIPEVLVILNAAIANRYFDFPAPIGFKKAHPDFRVIAAGNTTGHGADYEYVGRNQLDGASLDRFAIVKIDYCVEIENNKAGDIELANFCREFRRVANKTGVQVIVSYRAISRLAKMIQLLDLTEALETCLVKGLEKDDINVICNELSPSKYKDALMKVAA